MLYIHLYKKCSYKTYIDVLLFLQFQFWDLVCGRCFEVPAYLVVPEPSPRRQDALDHIGKKNTILPKEFSEILRKIHLKSLALGSVIVNGFSYLRVVEYRRHAVANIYYAAGVTTNYEKESIGRFQDEMF